MNIAKTVSLISVTFTLAVAATAYGSQDTLGPNGINALGLTTFTGQPLDGAGQDIGMVEDDRPGRPPFDNFQHSNATIVPEAVFIRDGAAVANGPEVDNHAEWVAGVMICTDPTATGVAPSANLYASAYIGDGILEEQAVVAAQHVATRGLGFVSAINNSYVVNTPPSVSDGNSLITLFTDWSAKRYDVTCNPAETQIQPPTFHSPPTISMELQYNHWPRTFLASTRSFLRKTIIVKTHTVISIGRLYNCLHLARTCS
jgi:hypothetical protein